MAVDATRLITAIVDRILRVALIAVIVCSPVVGAVTRGCTKRVGRQRRSENRRNAYSYTYSYTRISQILERKRGKEIGV
jgi:hypothetical protein